MTASTGSVLSMAMTVTRQQPDGTDKVEVITVETEYDATGQITSQKEGRADA